VRVAVVTTSWPRFEGDPSGHFVETEARILTRRGDEVTVIAAEGEAFGWPGFATRVEESPGRAVGAARWMVKARRAVRDGGFDRVVAHWAVPCGWPIAAVGGAELEVVSHGGDVRLLRRLPEPVRGVVVGFLAGRARRWRFVSEALYEELAGAVGGSVRKQLAKVAEVKACAIEVVPPTRADIDAKRARIGSPFAVSVGRLVESKRVEAAIAWTAERGVPLVIVGDGPARAGLEMAARNRQGRVTFTGRTTRGEALAWIGASAELVQASEAEGLSSVEREAEALGVPVTRPPNP
jgi:glycosyltransferase involved in cell wall biosynthesis